MKRDSICQFKFALKRIQNNNLKKEAQPESKASWIPHTHSNSQRACYFLPSDRPAAGHVENHVLSETLYEM